MNVATISLVLLILGCGLWWAARRLHRSSGLPGGRVVYADTNDWLPTERPLFSAAHRLTGRPDYVVEDGRHLIPIEVKSGPAPKNGPYESHTLQLAAYCLLVQENRGRRPPYGIIHYDDHTFEVDYTPALEESLLTYLQAMRQALAEGQTWRNHDDPARCAGCGYRYACDQSLVSD